MPAILPENASYNISYGENSTFGVECWRESDWEFYETASPLCAGIGVFAGSRSLVPREEAGCDRTFCRVDGPHVNVLAFSPPAILRCAGVLANRVLCPVHLHTLRTTSDLVAKSSLWWLTFVLPIAILAAFAHSNAMLRAGGFQVFDLPSVSMEQTISKDDRLIVDLWRYQQSKPVPMQIITFRREHGVWLKRLIATEGHTISGKDGEVFVDGVRLEEPYVRHIGHPPPDMNEFGPIQIPPGKLFVMGDNRDESADSRLASFGLIGEDRIAGQALYVLRSKDWRRNGSDLR
jgi:signal peptidase I